MGCGSAATAHRVPKGRRLSGPERSGAEAAIPEPRGYSTSDRLLAPSVLVRKYALAAPLTDAAVAFKQGSLPQARRAGALLLGV